MLRLGIDIGGTFTDFALADQARRWTAVHKRLTTPEAPERAVIEGVSAICSENGVTVDDIGEIIHGTTLITNALIERRGQPTGMLVTEGFRDTFDIGQEQRYDLYDLHLRFAEPLVARSERAEVTERLNHRGEVLVALDEDGLRASLKGLVEGRGIASLAICFLHSYRNPTHENRAAAIAKEMYPELYVSTSADVFARPLEYERWTTACANAYSQPMVDRYLRRLEEGLAGIGYAGALSIIASGGGLMTPAMARRYPVRLLESGPAAGVLMAARLSEVLDMSSVIAFDLGGTTAKGALVRNGEPSKKYSFEAAHAYKHKSGSGLTLQIPVIDMAEIGSGGGSIVAVDSLGLIRVGPRSASSVPGPACYGRGGAAPALTDANLILGYLDADFFLGGKMPLDTDAASRSIGRTVAQPLDMDLMRAAWGIHDIANEDISRAFRMHATERGFDYRRSSMVASGGGGPVHAARIARKLNVPRVIYPAGAGVMSAFGMLVGARSFEVVRAHSQRLDSLSAGELEALLTSLRSEVFSHLAGDDLDRSDIATDVRLDMRYLGQGYDIEVRLPQGVSTETSLAMLPAVFATAYKDVFHTTLDQPLEITGLKVEARAPKPEFMPLLPADRPETGTAQKGTRQAYFPAAGGLTACPVYDRYLLRPGQVIEGPCLVEERESTCLLDKGDRGLIDTFGNLVAEINTQREVA
ncbi:N-methylhydantoinase A [Alloyangia pacifica]|uniref:N-methylhydantoinase A n=2 Tax=Alloyangia pacifica TaxID=311180 RepID=A0A1I6WFX3_9RHOB|nr:N-methylhydantoinase A [Alloyangia pacifica]SFT24903.1 N-methylhydantoinase A [Alloyangia pacifica]